jgi:seryl-tRNA synthetase
MTQIGLEWGKDIADIAGNRAYVLSNEVFMLKHALMNYVIDFAVKKGYTMMNVPVFMNYNSMRKVCQLSDFEETLYEVSDKSKTEKDTDNYSKFYLTATSEQFLVAYHNNKKLKKNELPKRYCAHNECFRKETGSHGRDTSGIFRIHQFDKFEQFIVCNPDESATELHKLLEIIKEFYTSLGISFKIIAMNAPDINMSTSIKYDLEAYFPYSKNYKELVSCSNCTDYQAIKVNCKVENEYVHMLNCTLCAIQRTLCCICETYWDNDTKKLNIPEVLKSYMHRTLQSV